MASASPFSLNLLERKCTDVKSAVLYGLVVIAAVGISIYSGNHSSDAMTNITKCEPNQALASLRGIDYATDGQDYVATDLLNTWGYTFIGVGLATPLGILWLLLLRYHAKPIVYAT